MSVYKYIYGPVNSWRLGSSLGIDILPQNSKTCTFDCAYCQVGRARPVCLKTSIRGPLQGILRELKSLPRLKIDYITFSGSGEPTLATNLEDIIRSIRKTRKEKIAVFTNATLLFKKKVQQALLLADLVEVKLDADSVSTLHRINNPSSDIQFDNIVSGIKEFRARYQGKLCLQIMFTKDNIKQAKTIAEIARSINPDRVHLNTPLRPSGIMPVSRKDMSIAKRYFQGIETASVYDSPRSIQTKPIDNKATKKRRGSI